VIDDNKIHHSIIRLELPMNWHELARLDRVLLRNSLRDWLIALGVAAAVWLAVALARRVAVRRLSVIARRTETVLDDALVKAIQATRLWLVALFALYLGSKHLELPRAAEAALDRMATIAAFLQAGLWLGALLDFWIQRSRNRALETDLGAATSLAVLSFLGRLLLWAVVVLLVLSNLGINVTALVASLGIGGVAIALAVQNILGDLLASLSIVIDKPFVIGDYIVIDGFQGTVEHVGLKTTRLRSLDGEQIVFGNGDLLKARLRNYKRMRERRVRFGFGVLYSTPPDKLECIAQWVRAIVEAQPHTRFERAHFKGFGDCSLDFEVVYWMLDPDYNRYMDTQQAINLALLRRFIAEGIGFAYPSRSLYLETPVKLQTQPSTPD
jgi:small-conductance mechanosensitive channel